MRWERYLSYFLESRSVNPCDYVPGGLYSIEEGLPRADVPEFSGKNLVWVFRCCEVVAKINRQLRFASTLSGEPQHQPSFEVATESVARQARSSCNPLRRDLPVPGWLLPLCCAYAAG